MDLAYLVAQFARIGLAESQVLVRQFQDDATIPFLIRYRKNVVGDTTSDQLRFIKQMYLQAKNLKDKCQVIIRKLETKGELTNDLKLCLNQVQSIGELEEIYAPYKSSERNKISMLKEIGFDKNARNVLFGQSVVVPGSLVSPRNELLKNQKCADEMLSAMVVDLIYGAKGLESLVQDLVLKERIVIECSQASTTEESSEEKFENYYNFANSHKHIKPHQILAINRGEKKNMLNVKFVFPDNFNRAIKTFIKNEWFSRGAQYSYRYKIMEQAGNLICKKIQAKVAKRIRADLTRNAERVAVDVFASNLKHLLLTRPVRPHDKYVVLGIDPGFKHGCKVAVMNVKHVILDKTLLNLNNPNRFRNVLVNLSTIHKVSTIVIGNGQGCRQVEMIVSDLITKGFLKVQYVIVPEQGVSVYSCSKEAAEEYPNLEPNFISAVSLIKRHLDPLSEYVKVEPKHIGVGMYQHDIDPQNLEDELGEVISECVSEVGVDLNTAPLAILKRIAGLNEHTARKIIEIRERKGGFTSRKELLEVENVGPKTFEQCAGFVKIIPETCLIKKKQWKLFSLIPLFSITPNIKFNLLDQTIIHPDDYEKAKILIDMANLGLDELGTPHFIRTIKNFSQRQNLEHLAQILCTHSSMVKLIIDTLSTQLDFDVRANSNEPLFKTHTKLMSDLVVGLVLTGRVENVTTFGSFVDIGVGKPALIPDSKCKVKLHLGQTVSVKIESIRGDKVGLLLLQIIKE